MKEKIEYVLNDEFLCSILGNFYIINFSASEIRLQGHYQSDLVRVIMEQYGRNWEVKDSGFLEMQISKIEEQEEKKEGEQKKEITINFVLT